ncbi:MAG: NAD-binding protein [Verrucomicrobia bacterium]|nr:NAD-binding protein [Verrucomicrobiota bacterium]
MKFLTSQVAAFLEGGSSRRNLKLLVRFLLILVGMICTYSVLFHVIMKWEGQNHTWFTGFYWTLTVMSTLGFGDIIFHTDTGRLFSTVVLLSGMVFLLMLMPFTLIEFFYAPWVAAQARARAPRELPPDTNGHVILTNYDAVTAALIRKLNQFGYPYVLLVRDPESALKLHDDGINVMVGDPDLPETYQRIRLARAAMVVATGSDVGNTNIAFTIREESKHVSILTTASTDQAVDILQLAGSTRVFKLGDLMGQALARRTSGGDAVAHVIGHFDKLLIAEATASGTPLVGKTLAQAAVRTMAGVSVIGVWERGQFKTAGPDTSITGNTVLVMAGSAEQFRAYDELFCIYHINQNPVVIIGGGRVGRATGDALLQRKIDFRIVDKISERVHRFDERAVIGDASDIDVLEKAGIRDAPSVIITPNDDDMNVYLTIFCRKLRQDIQIISRSVRDRNVSTLHRAGADFVMSYASMGANIFFNCLKRSDILMIAEGLNIFKVNLPDELAGKSLIESGVRKKTGCTVIAVQENGNLQINPDPSRKLEQNEEILLISDAESEGKWFEIYGKGKE